MSILLKYILTLNEELLLHFKLGNFPRFGFLIVKYCFTPNLDLRQKIMGQLKTNLKTTDKFTIGLVELLFKLMPTCYIEGLRSCRINLIN